MEFKIIDNDKVKGFKHAKSFIRMIDILQAMRLSGDDIAFIMSYQVDPNTERGRTTIARIEFAVNQFALGDKSFIDLTDMMQVKEQTVYEVLDRMIGEAVRYVKKAIKLSKKDKSNMREYISRGMMSNLMHFSTIQIPRPLGLVSPYLKNTLPYKKESERIVKIVDGIIKHSEGKLNPTDIANVVTSYMSERTHKNSTANLGLVYHTILVDIMETGKYKTFKDAAAGIGVSEASIIYRYNTLYFKIRSAFFGAHFNKELKIEDLKTGINDVILRLKGKYIIDHDPALASDIADTGQRLIHESHQSFESFTNAIEIDLTGIEVPVSIEDIKYVTNRNLPLIFQGDIPNECNGVLTVENYQKWYSCYRIDRDGNIHEFSFEDVTRDSGDNEYIDDTVSPISFHETARRLNLFYDENTFMIVCKRWMEHYDGDWTKLHNFLPKS